MVRYAGRGNCSAPATPRAAAAAREPRADPLARRGDDVGARRRSSARRTSTSSRRAATGSSPSAPTRRHPGQRRRRRHVRAPHAAGPPLDVAFDAEDPDAHGRRDRSRAPSARPTTAAPGARATRSRRAARLGAPDALYRADPAALIKVSADGGATWKDRGSSACSVNELAGRRRRRALRVGAGRRGQAVDRRRRDLDPPATARSSVVLRRLAPRADLDRRRAGRRRRSRSACSCPRARRPSARRRRAARSAGRARDAAAVRRRARRSRTSPSARAPDWLETMSTIGPAPNACGRDAARASSSIAAVTLIGAGGRGLFGVVAVAAAPAPRRQR